MDTIQQIIAKISQVSNILIIAPSPQADSLASGLALSTFLKKLDKDVTLFCQGAIPEKFQFLPGIGEALQKIDLTKNFVIDVSTKKTKLSELSYKKDADKVSIFLKPTGGQFTESDVSLRSSSYTYELIILVGVSSLDELGEFHTQNTELFFEVPMVNIDFRGANENYGQFNLVNLAATSNAEVAFDLINKFELSLIDETIATQLLTGIIAETNSFQNIRTTPQTFLKASQLVSLGARQPEIINHLYKTKSLGLLKLWGRVLARLNQNQEANLVYSAVTQNDITRSEASEADVELIIKEMASQLGFAKIFLFLKEDSENQTTVYCHSALPINLNSLFAQYSPASIGPQTIKCVVLMSLVAAEKQILDQVLAEVLKLKPIA